MCPKALVYFLLWCISLLLLLAYLIHSYGEKEFALSTWCWWLTVSAMCSPCSDGDKHQHRVMTHFSVRFRDWPGTSDVPRLALTSFQPLPLLLHGCLSVVPTLFYYASNTRLRPILIQQDFIIIYSMSLFTHNVTFINTMDWDFKHIFLEVTTEQRKGV